jgi:hypothetical protein
MPFLTAETAALRSLSRSYLRLGEMLRKYRGAAETRETEALHTLGEWFEGIGTRLREYAAIPSQQPVDHARLTETLESLAKSMGEFEKRIGRLLTK